MTPRLDLCFHTVVLRFNLLETVKHNKYISSQITGCPL